MPMPTILNIDDEIAAARARAGIVEAPAPAAPEVVPVAVVQEAPVVAPAIAVDNVVAAEEPAPVAEAVPVVRVDINNIVTRADGTVNDRTIQRIQASQAMTGQMLASLNALIRHNVTLGGNDTGTDILAKARSARNKLRALKAIFDTIDYADVEDEYEDEYEEEYAYDDYNNYNDDEY